mgnify:CR=1 FL=1
MRNVYSVGQVNHYVKNMFTQDYFLRKVYVKGEVSNCKYHTSGHIYFSLKDETGTLSCVMFAGHRRGLAFRMKDGDKVVVGGAVDVYERDGRYQLYAKEITLEGAGALYERYLALKQELEDMGMFAQEYKQPIPHFIHTLGVVTAPTGAAVQDIRNILSRRFPFADIIMCPVLVQGENAPAQLIDAVQKLDKYNACDVIIIGRGGGSIEDLWAFNDENLAYAIYNCKIPVISAVGHETDFTICDFVSDLRAPTPSAAAELAVPDTAELIDYYKSQKQYVSSMATLKLRQEYNALTELKTRLSVVSPQQRIFEYEKSLELCKTKIQHFVQETINKKAADITKTAAKLEGLNPVKILSRGYSIAEKDGKAVNSAKMLKSGDEFTLRFSDGEIKAKATGE